MNFTIIDYMAHIDGHIIDTAPYKLSLIDYEEIQNGDYLKTPKSYTRVCKEIISHNKLNIKGRRSELVDKRSFIYDLLVNKGKNTTTYTAFLFGQDHSNILHHLKRVKYLKKDREYIENTRQFNNFFINYL